MSEEKLRKLKAIIKDKQELAIAFSGGIDSTFLLSVAVEVLGVDKVVAINVNSVLQSRASVRNCGDIIKNNFPQELNFIQVEVTPLKWQVFVTNCENRCYYCKKQMYTSILLSMADMGISILADGTNHDDLKQHRPGIKAIRELGIFTPLEAVGFTKKEIRSVAKQRSLSNYDLASNSCLATRIPSPKKITLDSLELIERAESFLTNLGINSSRVRLGDMHTIIEIEETDFIEFNRGGARQRIEEKFQKLGLVNPCLLLKGR